VKTTTPTDLSKGDSRGTPPIVTTEGTVEITDITPDLAMELLKHLHPQQRRLRKDHIENLARAMTGGTFRWNGEPYQLDRDLQVVNGQHRLGAIVRSGITHKNAIVVVLNDDRAIASIDQGRPRTLADVLQTTGHKLAPSTITSAILIEHCNFSGWRHVDREAQLGVLSAVPKPLMDDLMKLYKLKRRGDRKLVTAGTLAAAIRIMRANRDDGLAFFTALFTQNPVVYGENVDAIRVLYTFLMSSERMKRGVGSEEGIQEASYKTLRAWNAWRRGERVNYLRFDPSYSFPEALP